MIPREIGGVPVKVLDYNAFDCARDYTDSDIVSNRTTWLPLRSVVIPETVEVIEDSVFSYCQQLELVVCYAPLKSTGRGTFMLCRNLREVIFVNGVDEIDNYCFNDCGCLERVYWGDHLERIGVGAFQKAGIEELTVDARIVDEQAFWASKLQRLTLTDRVREIKAGAFYMCESLNYVAAQFSDAGVFVDGGPFGGVPQSGVTTVFPAETTEEQRRRFVSDASHELKTPLASIRLLADSIVQNENVDAATMREFVTDIGNEAKRLQRTTDKLLTLSRLDDSVERELVSVDVKQVVLDTLTPLRPLAQEKQVSLETALEDGCRIRATEDDLFHIVFNLVENAVKYNVPGGAVRIALRGDEKQVTLAVSDTGIGIPEEDRANIFSRFYRVDKARSREAGGSGLGLSIVHDTVLALGGSIEVGQNTPQGSVFTVSFPRPSSKEET